MKLRVEVISPTARLVGVEFSAGKVEGIIDAVVQQQDTNIAAVDFREGTSSAMPAENCFDRDVLPLVRQNMLDIVFASLIHEHKLQPVNRCTCEDWTLVRGQACSFSLLVEVIPSLPLPKNLNELTVHVAEAVVEPSVFFLALQRLRQAYGTEQIVTEARYPEDGDLVYLDVQATCAGVSVPGLCAQNLPLRMGDSASNPELCQIVRLLKVGELGSSTIPWPGNYGDYSLSGKEVQLDIRLLCIKKEILPELNDAFAAGLGKRDLRSLQEEIYKDLLNKVIVRHQREAEEKLLNSLIESLDFTIPPSLLIIQRKAYTLQARAFFEQQGFKGRDLKQQLEKVTSEVEEKARRHAKIQAFLMALAYREGLVVSEQELELEVQKMAQQTLRDPVAMKEELYNSNVVYELQDQMLADKALRLLYTKAQKIVVDKDGKPIIAQPSFKK